jgi:hypothetical protein
MDRARTGGALPAFIYPWATSTDDEECPATLPNPARARDERGLPSSSDPRDLHAALKSAMWRCVLDDDTATALHMASAALDLDPRDEEAHLIVRFASAASARA